MEQKSLIDEKRIKEGKELLKYTRRGLYEFIYGMKLIKDEKFYLDYGFQSMEDFAEAEFDMARTTMFRYLTVGSKFLPKILDNEQISQEVPHVGLFKLGLVKLEILSSLDGITISELITSGSITLNNKIYTIEDFKHMDRNKLRDLIQGIGQQPADNNQRPKKIFFNKLYSYTQKSFTKIILNIRECNAMVDTDKIQVEKKIKEIAKILDTYKSVDER